MGRIPRPKRAAVRVLLEDRGNDVCRAGNREWCGRMLDEPREEVGQPQVRAL